MTTTHDDATTWRELSDQLTAEQIDRLADMEQRELDDDALLFGAREYAQQNLNDGLIFGGVEWPAGARKVYACGERTDGRGWAREFAGTSREVAGITVYLDGRQFADGTVEYEISVGLDEFKTRPEGLLTVDEARQLKAALSDAIDELERLQ